MNFQEARDTSKDTITYTLTVTGLDILRAKIDPMDRWLQEDCASTNSIADKLLWLETLVRRIEEAYSEQNSSNR